MVESSQTLIPNAEPYRAPRLETGIEPMGLVEEALRANREASAQSTKKDNK